MRTAFTIAVVTALTAPVAHGDLVVEGLDGSITPMQAGWTYFALGNAAPADQVFSANRGIISQSTMGLGYAGQGSNYVYRTVQVENPSSWTLRARVRVSASEQWSFPFGAYIGFGPVGIGLMPTSISPLNGSWVTLPFDGSSWHEYRIETAACGRWTVFVDGVVVHEGVNAATSGALDLAFGDGTGGANANAQYDYIEVTVNEGAGADFDGNGVVDGADLATLLGQWGQPGITDLDCSGLTDGGDIGVLLGLWG
jgi:hypothetical protein